MLYCCRWRPHTSGDPAGIGSDHTINHKLFTRLDKQSPSRNLFFIFAVFTFQSFAIVHMMEEEPRTDSAPATAGIIVREICWARLKRGMEGIAEIQYRRVISFQKLYVNTKPLVNGFRFSSICTDRLDVRRLIGNLFELGWVFADRVIIK